MQPAGLSGWAPGQPTAVIDLGEEFAPDPSNASSAALQFSAAYYAVDSSAEGNGSKKRKVERACDFCRRRKARCDGPRMPDNVCSNCITNARSCTYLEGSKPRGPPKAYVVGLEDRLEKMEALLKRLRPESDFSAELGPPIVRDSWKTDSVHPASSSDKARSDSPKVVEHSPTIARKQSLVSLTAPPPNRACPTTSSGKNKTSGKKTKARKRVGQDPASNSDHDASCSSLSDSSETDDLGELSVVRGMKRLTLRGLEPTEVSPDSYLDDNQLRFHGKSSSFKLISTTRELMHQHIFESSSDGRQSNSPADVKAPLPTSTKRPEFWTLPPWEKNFEGASDPMHIPDCVLPAFPDPDLAEKLIKDYFELNTSTFALLHRPTFDRQWRDQLYTKNPWFACICLAIFGIASRWSDDPRVLPEEVREKAKEDEENGRKDIWSLAGWGYIAAAMKIHEMRRSVLLPPELFEIQSFALVAQYFRGTVAQHGSWFYLSVGVLKAQDVGAHRRKIYGRKPTVEEELWKRAYWHLVAFDRIGSMLIGRPCCSREEDLDLDLPLEVDDEYWENEDPELAWRQPEGKPSVVSGFVHWIKLSHIVAYALKTLYTPSKSKYALGLTGTQWKEPILEKLNDALLKWLDELPPHLRWRPDMEDRFFASQAATLHTTYHLVQIIIYRPFIRIPRPRSFHRPMSAQRSMFSQKALAICLNSARAGAYILDVQIKRGMLNITNVVHVSFVCAGVLLVHLWDLIRQYGMSRGIASAETRAQMSHEISSVMGEIGDLMGRLEEVSAKWELAREMLDEIKDALPNSPTEDAPRNHPFADTQETMPLFESNPVPIPGSHAASLSGHSHPQVSPLTPPEHYDLHSYRQEFVHTHTHTQQAGVPRSAPAQYPPPQHLNFSFDGGVPQLWDMDGAPASPPPLPDFNLFSMPPPPARPPTRFVPPSSAHAHKAPHPPPIYTHTHPSAPPAPTLRSPGSGSVPTIAASGHRGAAYHHNHGHSQGHGHGHSIRPPQPHAIRTSLPPPASSSSSAAYHEPEPYSGHPAHSPQGYVSGPGPGSSGSPTNPNPHPQTHAHTPLPPEYRASWYKSDEEPLGDHDCLRLKLLEEAYRQRPPPQVPGPGPGPGSSYSVSQHSPDQWANGGHRWS